jgi:anti-sigma B factor antagonist
MDLTVHTEQQCTATVMRPVGPLTARTTAVLEAALGQLFGTDATKFIVDLSGATRCDDEGVAILSSAGTVAAERGGELRLAAPTPAVCAWLRVSGLMNRIPTFVTVAGAVRADMLDLIWVPEREPRPWTVSPSHALAAARASVRHQSAHGRTRANQARWERPD